ncbi:MAG: MBL fold metallo-hydrolase [Nitrospirae bacterium]|nr:MBL fold metallo-hydrolase [Nitrospirota bacterium]
MKNKLILGEFELFWLDGGLCQFDGGTIFGAVPKVLWEKKYPCDQENYVFLTASPILVKTPRSLVLIESGLGNKLTDKQKKIFRLREEWRVPEDLKSLGFDRQDVDYVILTHYDWDHSSGVVMQDSERLALTFPNAKHLVQKTEWEDALNPNRRSINTYWDVNIETLKQSKNLELVAGDAEIVSGVSVSLTGGHTGGHQIVIMRSGGEEALHLGDLLPLHVHFNPLWLTAYDNFPLDTIRMKERHEKIGLAANAWFTFYHDPYYAACKFDEKGNIVAGVPPQVTSQQAG